MSYRSGSISFAESDMESDVSSPDMSQTNALDSISNETSKSQSKNRSKTSDRSNPGTYVVDYGPIRVCHRRSPPQTLATGRRSKDEPLFGEEAIKREIRRAKNRIASRELKKTREKIEADLIRKIQELEEEKCDLQVLHHDLAARKAQLNRAVYNARQAPLVPLITDLSFPSLAISPEQQSLLTDLYALLNSIDEELVMCD